MSFKKSLIKNIIEVIVLAITGFFVLRMIFNSWSAISSHIANANYYLLFFAWICTLIYFFARSLAWQRVIISLGGQINVFKANKIWLISEFSRYIPGNVWSFLGRIYLAKDASIAKKITVVSLFIEIIMLLTSALILAGFFIFLLPYDNKFISSWLFLFLIPILIILLTPRILKQLINFALKKVGKETVQFNIKFWDLLLILIIFLVGWTFYGLGSYLVMSAFINTSAISTPWLITVFVVAWLIGYISFITPMGLGVREGIITVILGPIISNGLAGFVAIITRLWLVFSELSVLGIIFLINILRKRR
jgi:uncharacterized membrane protein YbhN (UPF0104 family)